MKRYKTKIWVGPSHVRFWAEKCRERFGCLNVLEGTEHLYVINQDADDPVTVLTALREVFDVEYFPIVPTICEQHAAMRAPECGAERIGGSPA